MISKAPFFATFTKVLPASGEAIQINVTGSFFYCREATAKFQMRHSPDGQWYDFDQSFWFNLALNAGTEEPTIFTTLEFRAVDNVATTIFISVGNRIVGASMNMLRDPNNFQNFRVTEAKTLAKGFSAASIAASSSVTFYGTGGSGAGQAGAAYAYRKAIIITNNDAGQNLEIYASDGTTRLATAFPSFVTYFETSDDIIIKNETTGAIACRVMELFYSASV